MKRVALLCALVILCGLSLTGVSSAQPARTTIETIIANPGQFANNAVEFDGLVEQYVAATSSTTSYYLIKGEYGSVIKVNTADPAPETNRKYRVTGIVYIEPVGNEPFVSEKTKTYIDARGPATGGAQVGAGNTQGGGQQATGETKEVETPRDNTLIYLLVGLLVLLVGAFIYFVARRSKADQQADYSTPGTGGAAPLSPKPGFPEGTDTPTMSTSNDYKTVRIAISSPKTLKFVPGQLVIASGEDKGKSFRIAGYPTPEGSIVSIGRESVTGDRAYSHVQIDNKFSTVSRKQAEIISREGKLFVKNLSETNLTQVDGIEIKPGQLAELKAGSTIRTGELEFQYKL
jgi:hypothetical protein